ncbi:ribonuclease Oy isoform X2 [Cephus cinctus]|uniref:Ribonuclease Oy isoform X2 n=1 Tax=Cephus cinctus TaxID=211228 RepID=A0AAJ7W2S4_CEPCN|nr:ribonuclease Oy isoform X2 [Cephus cinctus]
MFLSFVFRFSENSDGRHKEVSGSNEFDLLIFTQHWPQTVCYQWKEDTESHDCSLPRDEEWTIHGIWPTQYHKLAPQFCNHSLHFNASALAPLEDQLNVKWLDVEKGTARYSFWKHEWQKHGTCAVVLDSINTEVKYFQKGLDLLDKYDMKHVLGKKNIVPGDNHSVQDILNAIETILGKRCQVECITNSKTKQSYLFEIRICFSKTFELIHCDGIHGFPTNCDLKKNVIYPSNVPVDYRVIQI